MVETKPISCSVRKSNMNPQGQYQAESWHEHRHEKEPKCRALSFLPYWVKKEGDRSVSAWNQRQSQLMMDKWTQVVMGSHSHHQINQINQNYFRFWVEAQATCGLKSLHHALQGKFRSGQGDSLPGMPKRS